MPRGRSTTVLAHRYDGELVGRAPADLAVEEPLEIRLDDHLVATTMRTPGHDFELAVGWCVAEGLLVGATVETIRYCGTGAAVDTEFNVVSVATNGHGGAVPVARLGTTSTSCGLCGSTTIDDLVERIAPLRDPLPIAAEVLVGLGESVRAHQPLFDATGGVHAAAAFTAEGELVVVREDVGRHNAVDKVVGNLHLAGGLPANGLGLWVSGRASFEMVQKAWAAGFATVVSVSAPSALAVEVAHRAGMTLAGFARGDTLRVYAGEPVTAG